MEEESKIITKDSNLEPTTTILSERKKKSLPWFHKYQVAMRSFFLSHVLLLYVFCVSNLDLQ